MRDIDHYYPYFTDEEDKAWRGLQDQHHSLESRGQGVPETQSFLVLAMRIDRQ